MGAVVDGGLSKGAVEGGLTLTGRGCMLALNTMNNIAAKKRQ